MMKVRTPRGLDFTKKDLQEIQYFVDQAPALARESILARRPSLLKSIGQKLHKLFCD